MLARNKQKLTFGELTLLRAIKAHGGSATFAQLSEVGIVGCGRVVERMLAPRVQRVRAAERPEAGSWRSKNVRPVVLRRTWRDGGVVFELTDKGRRAAAYEGPWYSEKPGWRVRWDTREAVVTGPDGGELGRFAKATLSEGADPEAAWKAFRTAVKRRFGIFVPQEAAPDFVRFPAALVDALDRMREAGSERSRLAAGGGRKKAEPEGR